MEEAARARPHRLAAVRVGRAGAEHDRARTARVRRPQHRAGVAGVGELGQRHRQPRRGGDQVARPATSRRAQTATRPCGVTVSDSAGGGLLGDQPDGDGGAGQQVAVRGGGGLGGEHLADAVRVGAAPRRRPAAPRRGRARRRPGPTRRVSLRAATIRADRSVSSSTTTSSATDDRRRRCRPARDRSPTASEACVLPGLRRRRRRSASPERRRRRRGRSPPGRRRRPARSRPARPGRDGPARCRRA